MLNFRKLRQDFSSNILKEGKELFDKKNVVDAKILALDSSSIRIASRVKGAFENVYESEIEIDRHASSAVDSNCDCTYTYDCQHIAALLFFLENNLNEIVVDYSKEADLDDAEEEVKETISAAEAKEDVRRDEAFQKEILADYKKGAIALGSSPFFLPRESKEPDIAELALLFQEEDIHLFLRLPSRSKPLAIPNIKAFLNAYRYRETLLIGGKRYFFTPQSFDMVGRQIIQTLIDHAQFAGKNEERYMRAFSLPKEELGNLLSKVWDMVIPHTKAHDEPVALPFLYVGSLEEPLVSTPSFAQIECTLEYLEAPAPTLLMQPSLLLDEESVLIDEVHLFESSKPGIIHNNTYYRFPPHIRRLHLKALGQMRDIAIPEPLFGSFVENSLPVLRQYAHVTNPGLIEQFNTLPYPEEIKGRCVIHYLNLELEAALYFTYNDVEIPASFSDLTYDNLTLFVGEEGILARNLVEEKKVIDEIFEDFIYDPKEGVFRIKSEKKIVEFMTETIPNNQHRIEFECPENLLKQFIYDDTTFEMKLTKSPSIDAYTVALKVDGYLTGIRHSVLWDCVVSKKRFLELDSPKEKGLPRILVLDLERIAPLVQIFDDMGLQTLSNHKEDRPLWSLTTLNASQFKDLPVKFSMTKELKAIQKQILGENEVTSSPVPTTINAKLRNYQLEGVQWLEKLRSMLLGGILADDMGLGKTLQAIIAVTQTLGEEPSLIVCPTSLVYNWKEEFHKFAPHLSVLVVDAIPSTRKKLLKTVDDYDVVITSYNLLQKDIETYKTKQFNYVILDEAQHIKNRGTRNAKSVKQIRAKHRLILTGTPIENSLEELWSLFDFLMPGLLSSYDRFVEKFIRPTKQQQGSGHLEVLKRKVSPFILRRMKEDVLDDLPPVSEILYHCHLTETQQELYRSYAESAKEELSKLVKKEGFDKIQIHVLATLTRLKQICCHPAIFAKEKAELGDSAKYDMLQELIGSLMESNHKTVIFSQYTKMLTIMREDLQHRGIPFAYLDGSSKNRLNIVNKFNEDPNIPIFLVSLKAGGSGLNLVGADTVVHYDMWWNPAVENQATDRVHRLGQKKSVSSYKLVTLNTIEEKILNLQKRKKGLVKKVISSDDEAISKLTWEEVLELLQT